MKLFKNRIINDHPLLPAIWYANELFGIKSNWTQFPRSHQVPPGPTRSHQVPPGPTSHQVPRFPDPQIPRSPDPQIPRSPDPTDPQMSRVSNFSLHIVLNSNLKQTLGLDFSVLLNSTMEPIWLQSLISSYFSLSSNQSKELMSPQWHCYFWLLLIITREIEIITSKK